MNKKISVPDKLWVDKVISGEALFDWNKLANEKDHHAHEPSVDQLRKISFRSEDFRDAMGVAKRVPLYDEKIILMHFLYDVGVEYITLDIFSSTSLSKLNKSNQSTLDLLNWMSQNYPKLKPVILARSTHQDLEFLKEAYDLNNNLVAIIFQDLSEVRRMVEGWGDFTDVLSNLVKHITYAKDYGMEVMAFTENLSITRPEEVTQYVIESCKANADWIGIADTAGRLIPSGASCLTSHVAEAVKKFKEEESVDRDIGIVFHGHNDLGNAVSNSIAAIASGATIIDVVVNGLGERVGNTDLIELSANCEYRLQSMGEKSRFDLKLLKPLSTKYSELTETKDLKSQAVVGDGAFSTHFGIHANYYYKVEILSELIRDEGYSETEITLFKDKAWKVYSALSPADCGVKPDIKVSSFSGASNVILRLKHLDLIDNVRDCKKDAMFVKRILQEAKKGWGELSDEKIISIWNDFISSDNRF